MNDEYKCRSNENATRLEDKIDRITDNIGDMKVHMAEVQKDLKYHIKRTDLLESKVVPMWLSFKAVGLLAGILGVLAAIAEVLSFIKK